MCPSFQPSGPATPVVAALASGTDREQTIGEMYGGKAGEPGITDQVYLSLGKVSEGTVGEQGKGMCAWGIDTGPMLCESESV